MERATVKEKLEWLPDRPGVYLFRDAQGETIYIGKARSLKNRVRSYFHAPRNLTAKVLAMVRQIADLEHIITDNEVEALILEANLIKQYRPKYNIRLRDDKNYPYLRVDLNEEWPRLQLVRSTRPDKARYFGPFTRSEAVRETMRVLRRVFPYRSCSDRRLKQGGPPCLYYHIHRCPAPCDGKIEREEYLRQMQEMVEFLEGKQQKLLQRMKERMMQAAENLDFEKAAELRDQIQALQQVLEQQKVVGEQHVDQDVVGMARNADVACMQVFFVREGKIVGREHFLLQQTSEESDAAVMTAFLKQFYQEVQQVPPSILLSVPPLPEEIQVLQQWLTEKRGRGGQVRLAAPQRGKKRQLVHMVEQNAEMVLDQEFLRLQRYGGLEGVRDLKEKLGLPKEPNRIECFDISNIQGSESVASMVVFVDGKPFKSHYRKFRIRTVEGPDDFQSMQEVVYRRFKKLQHGEANRPLDSGNASDEKSDASFEAVPDLIIIDGGKGQLSAAREVLRHLGLESIPTYGLAKKNEWLFEEGSSEPIILPRRSAALFLLQRVRDEAHRFALGFHRKSRSQSGMSSLLDEVPGLGAKRKRELLKRFGSLEGIRNASLEELAAVPSMNHKVAANLYDFLRN